MIKRAVEGRIRAALADTPVVLIHGARQTGKTTLARHLAGKTGATYLTMDDAGTLAAAAGDPQGFIRDLPPRTILDEIQRVPELFPAIKLEVDRHRTPGRFLLTGSANVLALPHLSESLAGRMEVIPLFPFAQSEIERHRGNFVDWIFGRTSPRAGEWGREGPGWVHRVCEGGFPEAVRRKDAGRRDAWFASYITTVLQRDVRDLARVDGLVALPHLLGLLASRTAGLLNLADIARTVGVPHTTVTRYCALLEMLFLVMRLPPWFANIGKRLSKTPKIHLCDTGLAAHLLHLSAERVRKEMILMGGMLESFVVMELMKHASWAATPVRLFCYRTVAGSEVDVVLEDRRGMLVGVEVKASGTIRKDDFKGISALMNAVGKRFLRGVVLYTGTDAVPFGAQKWALPIHALWDSGRNAARAIQRDNG